MLENFLPIPDAELISAFLPHGVTASLSESAFLDVDAPTLDSLETWEQEPWEQDLRFDWANDELLAQGRKSWSVLRICPSPRCAACARTASTFLSSYLTARQKPSRIWNLGTPWYHIGYIKLYQSLYDIIVLWYHRSMISWLGDLWYQCIDIKNGYFWCHSHDII